MTKACEQPGPNTGRIGRIRCKKSGRELVILPEFGREQRAEILKGIADDLQYLRGNAPRDLIGYVLFCWTVSNGWVYRQIGIQKGSPFWEHEMPDIVKGHLDAITRDGDKP